MRINLPGGNMQPNLFSRRQFVQVAGFSAAGAALAPTFSVPPAHAATAGTATMPNYTTAASIAAVSAPRNFSQVTVEPIGSYDLNRLNRIVTTELAEFSNFKAKLPAPRFPINLYRITYPSVIPEQDNRPTLASGLIAIPDLAAGEPADSDAPAPATVYPVVSYQHGTVFGKTEVPSHPDESMETRLMLAAFAAHGYVLIGADYFGRGLSPETDSYLVKGSTQQACLDMFRAAVTVFPELGVEMGPFFVSGWSQGGWATLVLLEKLEGLGIPVTAASIASAPTDLFAIINRWLHNPQPVDAAYLPGLICMQSHAYETYYGLPGLAASLIKPQYQEAALQLYLSQLTLDEIAQELPTTFAELVEPSFIASSSSGASRYWRLVQDNHGYRWRTATPLRSYWGGVDEVTPEYIAALPVGYQQIMGGAPVTAIGSGPTADHRGNFVYSVVDQKPWFDALAAAN
jgi:hypothetical protein